LVHGRDDRPPYKYATLAGLPTLMGQLVSYFPGGEKVYKLASRREEFEPARKVRESQLQTEMEITKNKNPQARLWIFYRLLNPHPRECFSFLKRKTFCI
jgi:hypothetical protein